MDQPRLRAKVTRHREYASDGQIQGISRGRTQRAIGADVERSWRCARSLR